MGLPFTHLIPAVTVFPNECRLCRGSEDSYRRNSRMSVGPNITSCKALAIKKPDHKSGFYYKGAIEAILLYVQFSELHN